MTAIVAEHLCLQVPGRTKLEPPRPVLSHVSLSIAPGEVVAIIGPSGAGKSSLLACLAGIDRPTRGTVTLLGANLQGLRRNKLAAFRLHHVALVLQADNLFSALSCRENVVLPTRLRHRVPQKRLLRTAERALDAVGMAWASSDMPATLSGGERQRVALARLLATPAEIVLVDEPTAALDEVSSASTIDLLRERAAAGSAVALVTHDLAAAARADRAIVLAGGRILVDAVDPSREALERWIRGPSTPQPTSLPGAGRPGPE